MKNIYIAHDAIINKKVILAKTSRAIPKKYEKTKFGKNIVINNLAIIFEGSSIGENTYIGDLAYIRENVTIGKNCLIGKGVTIENNVVIGDDVKILTDAYITADVTIGNNVFIGPKVVTTNDNTIGRSKFFEYYQKGGCIIEDNVRIGAGVIILPHIKIKDSACIAAGTIVTKDVGRNKAIKGNPGKVFNYGFQDILGQNIQKIN